MTRPDPIFVGYDQYTGAKFWADFAAHAMGATLAGSKSPAIADAAVSEAARLADLMLAEFRARFEFQEKETKK